MFDAPLEGFESLAEMLERRGALGTTTAESTGWMERVTVAARVENQAAAAQLVAIGGLYAHRFAQCAESADWAVDAVEAAAAEVGAGLRISRSRAATKVHYARAMRERLPETAAVFCAGDIDLAAFATIVFRTDLIEDAQVLAGVDELIAANVGRWPSLTRGRLSGQVDKILARVDADAVRRRRERQQRREVWIGPDAERIAQIEGTLATPDARALDQRLSALAATVCPHDPRTREERRADGLGALAAGADRLGCRCGRRDCAAGDRRAASPVVIHVIAEQATVEGRSLTPACQVGADGLITAELLRELAISAKLVPLAHPGYVAPESGYTPSKALAEFVRARDLTCRWPGCDVPATRCDLDHTIPYAQGGPTHAANLKSFCRTHHLVKTFWGWRDQQLADGTLILTSPSGDTYVTTPGSALLFPSLCGVVGGMPAPEIPPPADYCAERTAMMPKRRRTRAQDRATRVATERAHNRAARTVNKALRPFTDPTNYWAQPPPDPDEPPSNQPPF